MGYQDKMTQITKVIADGLGPRSVGGMTEMNAAHKAAEVITKLREAGATNEDALTLLCQGDLTQYGIPVLVARKVLQIAEADGFVGGGTRSSEQIIVETPEGMAARMRPEELVEKYDLANPTNAIGVRLKAISGGAKFIVFNSDDTTINVDETKKLIREIADGFPALPHAVIGDKLYQLYAVGERPNVYGDEHPCCVGQLLRPNGYSADNIHWGLLPLDVRQLISIAYREGGEAKTWGTHWTYSQFVGKTFEEVALLLPKAHAVFLQLKETNSLPSLKVKLTPKVA